MFAYLVIQLEEVILNLTTHSAPASPTQPPVLAARGHATAPGSFGRSTPQPSMPSTPHTPASGDTGLPASVHSSLPIILLIDFFILTCVVRNRKLAEDLCFYV